MGDLFQEADVNLADAHGGQASRPTIGTRASRFMYIIPSTYLNNLYIKGHRILYLGCTIEPQ